MIAMIEEDEKKELEAQLERLKERRAWLEENSDEYIADRLDGVMDSILAVEERLADEPNLSMWEHLHGVMHDLEENSDEVVGAELLRIDARIEQTEERLNGD